jgi:hypothetical protein
VSLTGKAMLFEGAANARGPRVAARLSLNLAGASRFTSGNFGGIGLSFDQPLSSWVTFHGDVRATALFDRVSEWNLPLKRSTVGFSAATELKITRNNSVTLQYDGSTTPYEATGTMAFDKGYGDLAIGVSHRSANGRVVTQFYARENMNLPFQVRGNMDPDLAVGIKTTFRTR